MHFKQFSLLFLSLALLLTAYSQEYNNPSVEYFSKLTPIVNLTEVNFDDFVQNPNLGSWFVMFYAPWCAHSKNVTPSWIEFSKKVYGKVNIAITDSEANSYLRRRFFIEKYPTFLYFENGKMYFYKGERNVEEWEKFVNGGYKEVEGEVVPRRASSLGAFMREIKIVWKQLTVVIEQHPFALIGIVAFVLFMVFLSFVAVNWLNRKLDRMEKGDENTQANEGKAVEAGSKDKKLKKE